MLDWLSSNATGLSILGAAIAFTWSVAQFILVRRKELEAREFESYHRLIKELVSMDPETKSLWMDRQIAVIFELRHFPRYYEVTARILTGLREYWGQDAQLQSSRLMQELDLTLAYIRQKRT